MFRFVGFKKIDAPKEDGTSMMLERVPNASELIGDFKISRFCNGYGIHTYVVIVPTLRPNI